MHFFCSKDCPDLCGVRVEENKDGYVFHGMPEKWSAPGFVCGKLKTFVQREMGNGLRSWERTHGQKKEFANDAEALAALAAFFAPFRDKKILYLRGSGSLAYNMACWDLLFSQRTNCWGISGGPCDATGCDTDQDDFGALINPEITNLENADTIVLWGKNARATSQHLYVYLKKLKGQGKHIVSIDPVCTETARLADLDIRIRPGCDGLLACALLTALGYESGHAIPALLNRAGVVLADFETMQGLLHHSKSAHIKGFSIQRYTNGGNSYRWINRLAVRTGCMDLLYFGHSSKLRWEAPGASFSGHIPVHQIADALADGEFDLYVNVAANPAMTYPDSNRWAKGLARTPTLVIDSCQSRTAEQADFFPQSRRHVCPGGFHGQLFFQSGIQSGTTDRRTQRCGNCQATGGNDGVDTGTQGTGGHQPYR